MQVVKPRVRYQQEPMVAEDSESDCGCGTVLGCCQHTFTGTFEEAIRQGWATKEEIGETAKRALEDLRDYELRELFTFFQEL